MSTEEVLLILNCMVYSETITLNDKKEKNVFDLVDKGFEKPKSDAIATQDEWNALIATVKANEKTFSNIQLVNVEGTQYKEKNVTFINNNSATPEVYVVYKGTGELEWHDNALGGLASTTITPQQQNAVDYATKIGAQFPDLDLYVSGHSKGGNKAQVATILVDDVTHGYSFDGQGMGSGFLDEYEGLIAKNKNKLTSISNSCDFVNPMFTSIAGHVLYTKNNKSMVDYLSDGEATQLAHQHSPLSMYSISDGLLIMQSTQGIARDSMADFLGNVVDYFKETMSEEDFKIFTNMMMHMMEVQGVGCSDPNYNIEDIPGEFWLRLGFHLADFAGELNMSMDELSSILLNVDAFIPSDNLMKYILKSLLVNNPLYTTNSLYSLTKGKTSKGNMKANLNEMLVRYNQGYQAVKEAKETLHDFSQKIQDEMHQCFKSELSEELLSIETIPGFYEVKDLLFQSDAIFQHNQAVSGCRDILDEDYNEQIHYEEVVSKVYEKDTNVARDLASLTNIVKGYRELFKK